MFVPGPDLTDASALAGLVGALGDLPQDVDDSALIDRIHALEELRSAVAAAQARATATFVASQRAQQLAKGVPADRADRGIATQVALARRISPHQATRYTGWATILSRELPHTFAALQQGRTSEWRALVVTKESVFLSKEHRAVLDADLAPGWSSSATGGRRPASWPTGSTRTGSCSARARPRRTGGSASARRRT